MASSTITVRITVAWWIKPYLIAVALLCHLMRTEPNMQRVGYWIGKGIKIK